MRLMFSLIAALSATSVYFLGPNNSCEWLKHRP